MPFKSAKQKRFFGMCAGHPGAAKMKCPDRATIDKFFREDRKSKRKKKK